MNTPRPAKRPYPKNRRARFNWTLERSEKLKALALLGLSSTQIGAEIGCQNYSVVKRAIALGVKLLCTPREGGLKRGRPADRVPLIDGDIARIPLTQGFCAIIDIADLPLVLGLTWYVSKRAEGHYYASATPPGERRQVHLQRVLMNAPMEMCVDHKDGDPMNNRRENLRVCTYAQNCFNKGLSKNNTSGKSGVRRHRNSWVASVYVNDETIRLGSFSSFEEAVRARLAGEQKYYGEYARRA